MLIKNFHWFTLDSMGSNLNICNILFSWPRLEHNNEATYPQLCFWGGTTVNQSDAYSNLNLDRDSKVPY